MSNNSLKVKDAANIFGKHIGQDGIGNRFIKLDAWFVPILHLISLQVSRNREGDCRLIWMSLIFRQSPGKSISFIRERNSQVPTLDRLHAVFKDEIYFSGSKSKLLKVYYSALDSIQTEIWSRIFHREATSDLFESSVLEENEESETNETFIQNHLSGWNNTLRECWLDKYENGGFGLPLGKEHDS